MSEKKRKNFSADFNVKEMLETIHGVKTLNVNLFQSLEHVGELIGRLGDDYNSILSHSLLWSADFG